jgi:hypothetical protein
MDRKRKIFTQVINIQTRGLIQVAQSDPELYARVSRITNLRTPSKMTALEGFIKTLETISITEMRKIIEIQSGALLAIASQKSKTAEHGLDITEVQKIALTAFNDSVDIYDGGDCHGSL